VGAKRRAAIGMTEPSLATAIGLSKSWSGEEERRLPVASRASSRPRSAQLVRPEHLLRNTPPRLEDDVDRPAHLTPPGFTVTVGLALQKADGMRLTFYIRAREGIDSIGEGAHERFVIARERFLKKLQEKLAAARAGARPWRWDGPCGGVQTGIRLGTPEGITCRFLVSRTLGAPTTTYPYPAVEGVEACAQGSRTC